MIISYTECYNSRVVVFYMSYVGRHISAYICGSICCIPACAFILYWTCMPTYKRSFFQCGCSLLGHLHHTSPQGAAQAIPTPPKFPFSCWKNFWVSSRYGNLWSWASPSWDQHTHSCVSYYRGHNECCCVFSCCCCCCGFIECEQTLCHMSS